jgi:hypothetical protein
VHFDIERLLQGVRRTLEAVREAAFLLTPAKNFVERLAEYLGDAERAFQAR